MAEPSGPGAGTYFCPGSGAKTCEKLPCTRQPADQSERGTAPGLHLLVSSISGLRSCGVALRPTGLPPSDCPRGGSAAPDVGPRVGSAIRVRDSGPRFGSPSWLPEPGPPGSAGEAELSAAAPSRATWPGDGVDSGPPRARFTRHEGWSTPGRTTAWKMLAG